jgi:hypothetical protein
VRRQHPRPRRTRPARPRRPGTRCSTTTANHPWLTADHGWLPAGFLHLSEPVQRADGSTATVVAIQVVPGTAAMWDLSVANVHTFAVGDAQMVVHNCGGGGGDDPFRTLQPGPYARESIAARGPKSAFGFKEEERAQIDEIGNEYGCHTCGTRNPVTPNGRWIPDHQPPDALNFDNQPQQLYPHCYTCSRSQGGTVATIRRVLRWFGMTF